MSEYKKSERSIVTEIRICGIQEFSPREVERQEIKICRNTTSPREV